jgi:hypothetical protein
MIFWVEIWVESCSPFEVGPSGCILGLSQRRNLDLRFQIVLVLRRRPRGRAQLVVEVSCETRRWMRKGSR